MNRILILAAIALACATWALAETGSREAFAALVAEFDDHELAHDPIRAGRRGDLDAASRWPDRSPGALAERRRAEARFLERLEAISPDALDDSERVSFEVMDYLLRSRARLGEFEPERIPFTNDSGFFSVPLQMALSTRPRTPAEAEAWLARLHAMPEYFAQHVAWMRRGLETRFVQPPVVVSGVIDQLRVLAGTAAGDSPLLAPLGQLPPAFPEAERERLRERARAIIADEVLPAYRELLEFFESVYAPGAREGIGISGVPGGREYYRALVRHHTTLQTTPEEVHRRGLAEVERIRAEMDTVIARAGFEGSFAEFVEFLRTDPRFYAQSERELLMHAAFLAKRADDAMPRFFGYLPRLPYGVRPVPEAMAPNYTTGRYWPGDMENGIAGGYMVNTHRLDQRPLYELPALTVHEAVPGHHHQFAVSAEIEDAPEFRRNTYITAFGEGWALYTEHLAIEMGLYETPYEDFGRLSYEMWRACRLVVDTGIHYFGWTREQAESCFLDNSALAPHNVRTEVDRYISWPGQALAYKTGELKIRDLRAEAEARLGEAFDLRAFHDHLLIAGAMPLSALEARMKDWIEARAGDS